MVPPQESPTFHAVSSATPNSSVFGLPLSITSSASVTTAPSTQPPETLPRKLPSSSITKFEPTGRGAEPQVSTTVASATPRPSLRQSSAAFRISSSVARVVMVYASPIVVMRNSSAAGSVGSLSHGERGGVRGYGLSIGSTPLTLTLSPPGRGNRPNSLQHHGLILSGFP